MPTQTLATRAPLTAIPLVSPQTFSVEPVGDFAVRSTDALDVALRPVDLALRKKPSTWPRSLMELAGGLTGLAGLGGALVTGLFALVESSQSLAQAAVAAGVTAVASAVATGEAIAWQERRSLTTRFAKAVKNIEDVAPLVVGDARAGLVSRVDQLAKNFAACEDHPLAERLRRVARALSEPSSRVPDELDDALRVLETKGAEMTGSVSPLYYTPVMGALAYALVAACSPERNWGAMEFCGVLLAGSFFGPPLAHVCERFGAKRAYERFDRELGSTVGTIERLASGVRNEHRDALANRLANVTRQLGELWRDADWTMGRSIEEQPTLRRLLVVQSALRQPVEREKAA